MDNPHFTIIIPTKDRADTLVYTLKSCLQQKNQNFSVLVSDNCSSDNTKLIVDSFSDSRICYKRTSKKVSMRKNWEFALDHIESDGFIFYLGDDDALLTYTVENAAKIITNYSKTKKIDALVWQKVEYGWPNCILTSLQNQLTIPYSNLMQVYNGKKQFKKLYDHPIPYTKLPCLYNSFVSMEAVNKAIDIYGKPFFKNESPDMYSGVSLSQFCERYLYTTYPLSINGASNHSAGISGFYGKTDDEKAISNEFKKIAQIDNNEKQVHVQSINYALYTCLKSLDPHTNKINKENWFNSILFEIRDFGGDNFYEKIENLSKIEDFSAFFPLEQQSKLKCNRNVSKVKIPDALNSNQIRIDLSRLGIYEVHGASHVTSAIMENVYPKESEDIFKPLSKKIKEILSLHLIYVKRKIIDLDVGSR